jgi:hypothetical protein
VSAGQHEAAEDRAEGDDVADGDEHGACECGDLESRSMLDVTDPAHFT